MTRDVKILKVVECCHKGLTEKVRSFFHAQETGGKEIFTTPLQHAHNKIIAKYYHALVDNKKKWSVGMRILKRASIKILKKKGASILLLVIMILLFTVTLACNIIQRSVDTSAKSAKSDIKATVA